MSEVPCSQCPLRQLPLFLTHSEEKFRLSYILGPNPIADEDDEAVCPIAMEFAAWTDEARPIAIPSAAETDETIPIATDAVDEADDPFPIETL